jgi:hypothetical protein
VWEGIIGGVGGTQECIERQTKKSDFWRRALELNNGF